MVTFHNFRKVAVLFFVFSPFLARKPIAKALMGIFHLFPVTAFSSYGFFQLSLFPATAQSILLEVCNGL
jgi:hypothetical protein